MQVFHNLPYFFNVGEVFRGEITEISYQNRQASGHLLHNRYLLEMEMGRLRGCLRKSTNYEDKDMLFSGMSLYIKNI